MNVGGQLGEHRFDAGFVSGNGYGGGTLVQQCKRCGLQRRSPTSRSGPAGPYSILPDAQVVCVAHPCETCGREDPEHTWVEYAEKPWGTLEKMWAREPEPLAHRQCETCWQADAGPREQREAEARERRMAASAAAKTARGRTRVTVTIDVDGAYDAADVERACRAAFDDDDRVWDAAIAVIP